MGTSGVGGERVRHNQQRHSYNTQYTPYTSLIGVEGGSNTNIHGEMMSPGRPSGHGSVVSNTNNNYNSKHSTIEKEEQEWCYEKGATLFYIRDNHNTVIEALCYTNLQDNQWHHM